MNEKKLPQDQELTAESQELQQVESIDLGAVPSDFVGTQNAIVVEPSTFGSLVKDGPIRKLTSKWSFLFVALAMFQVIGVGLLLLAIAGAARDGLGALVLFAMLLLVIGPAGMLMALINLIALPIYIVKRKIRGIGLILGIVSLMFSLALLLYGTYSFYQVRFASQGYDDYLTQLSWNKEA